MPSFVAVPEIPYEIDSPARRTPAAGVATAPTTPLPTPFISPKNPPDLTPCAGFYTRPFTPEKISEPNPIMPYLKPSFIFSAF